MRHQDCQQKELSLSDALQLIRIPSRTNPELYQRRKNVLIIRWKARSLSRHPELQPFFSDRAHEDFADQMKKSTSFFQVLANIPGGQRFILEFLRTIPEFLKRGL